MNLESKKLDLWMKLVTLGIAVAGIISTWQGQQKQKAVNTYYYGSNYTDFVKGEK